MVGVDEEDDEEEEEEDGDEVMVMVGLVLGSKHGVLSLSRELAQGTMMGMV